MYHPPQRIIPLRLLTPAGWLSGSIHIPAASRLLEFLDHAHDFISMTDVVPEGATEPLPFVAVQRSAVTLVIPETVEALSVPHFRPMVKHTVDCLVPGGRVTGLLEVPRDVRLSDELAREDPTFSIIYDAACALRGATGTGPVVFEAPAVLVNRRLLVAVTEPGHYATAAATG